MRRTWHKSLGFPRDGRGGDAEKTSASCPGHRWFRQRRLTACLTVSAPAQLAIEGAYDSRRAGANTSYGLCPAQREIGAVFQEFGGFVTRFGDKKNLKE